MRKTLPHLLSLPLSRNRRTGVRQPVQALLAGLLLILCANTGAAELPPPENRPANFSAETNPYLNTAYREAEGLRQIDIHNAAGLTRALQEANRNQGRVSLNLADGTYTLASTLHVRADFIQIRSASGKAEKVVIQGGPDRNTGLPVLIKVHAKHFSIQGVTLQNARFHLLQIAGEDDADYPVIRNCVFQDSYQQLLKISYDREKRPQASADFGLVEDSVFRYSDGIAPNYYTGGVDLHGGNSWIIRRNSFRDIASPSRHIAEHAIHVWNNAFNTLAEGNTIIDCDRGIGFGMGQRQANSTVAYSHYGGLISNNLIVHSDNGDPFADAAIILEDSPKTRIRDNRIWMAHAYRYAIEYRFRSTRDVIIENNLSNKRIRARDGAQAQLRGNRTAYSLKQVLAGRKLPVKTQAP